MAGLTVSGVVAVRVLAVALAAIVLGCGGAPGRIFTAPPAPGSTTAPPASPVHPTTELPAPATATTVPPATDSATRPPSPTDGPPQSPVAPEDVFVPIYGFPTGGAFEVTGVTTTPTGFTAVGFGGLGGEDYFGRRQGMVWSSADGLNWSQSAPPELQYVTPVGIVSLGTDVFLLGTLSICPQIIEDTCADAPDAGNAMWRSSGDGAWQRLNVPPQLQAGFLDGMVGGAGRIAVFGATGDDAATTLLWLTADGTNWSETADVAGLDPITAIGLGDGGLAALGTVRVAELESIRLVAAHSSDGTTFTPASVPELIGATIEDVVFGPNGFAGVGYEATDDVSLSGIALQSSDGQSWTRADSSDGSFDGSGLVDVQPMSNGYVALGFSLDEEDFTVQHGGAWISADGQSWRALAPLDATFTHFGASALGPVGLVVFTADQLELDDESFSSTILGWFAPTEALIP